MSEEDLETIDYNEQPNENIFEGDSVLAAANKVLDFDKFKKETADALDKMKNELFLEESVLVLVLVDLFSSKVCSYPIKSRKQIHQKLEQFYRDVKSKKKGKK